MRKAFQPSNSTAILYLNTERPELSSPDVRRAILGAVYSASLLYWLDDDSDDHEATWAFIDRRIDSIMKFEKTKASAKKAMAWVPNPARFLGRLRYPAV